MREIDELAEVREAEETGDEIDAVFARHVLAQRVGEAPMGTLAHRREDFKDLASGDEGKLAPGLVVNSVL